MDNVNYFKDLFGSIPKCRDIVLLMFLIKNDVDLLTECGYLKNDISRFCEDFKNLLSEQNEDYLNYVKNEED